MESRPRGPCRPSFRLRSRAARAIPRSMISPGALGTVVAFTLLVVSGLAASGRTRPPAVSGAFYPSDPADLRAEVEGFLDRAAPVTGPAIAVIAPHAGYVFSGATAGRAFAALRGVKASRVILLGPSHHAGFTGGALPDGSVSAFATPLGEIPLDMEALARLRTDPVVRRTCVGPRSGALAGGRAALPPGRGARRPSGAGAGGRGRRPRDRDRHGEGAGPVARSRDGGGGVVGLHPPWFAGYRMDAVSGRRVATAASSSAGARHRRPRRGG